MNKLLTLNINDAACLSFLTDIEDDDFINLNNTFICTSRKPQCFKTGDECEAIVDATVSSGN